ncbi:MAG: replication initiator protein A [Defluviitaleaceae bacterium]|nr:replication initiator protein A [Defluviitaleaceae bacterium]
MDKRRVNKSDIDRQRFYKLPKFLFEGEFMNLTNDARTLYSVLLDRMELSKSRKNDDWVNEKGEVYLVFTQEKLAEAIGISVTSVKRGMKVLMEYGLLEQERQGLNRPNKIFLFTIGESILQASSGQTNLTYPVRPENRTDQFDPSEQASLPQPDGSNLPSNETNIKKTDTSDTDLKHTNLCTTEESACATSQPRPGLDTTALPTQEATRIMPNDKHQPDDVEGNTMASTTELFDIFWEEYPKKVGKAPAIKAWETIAPDETKMIEIMTGLEAAKAYWIAKNTKEQYIPHPATWLKDERWKDKYSNVHQDPHIITQGQEYQGQHNQPYHRKQGYNTPQEGRLNINIDRIRRADAYAAQFTDN